MTIRALELVLDLVYPPSSFELLLRRLKPADIAGRARSLEPLKISGAESVHSVFRYEDRFVRAMVWALKFGGSRRAARLMAEILCEEILEELAELAVWKNFKNPLLVPIPLSKKRFRERGFNQTERVAKMMSEIDGGKSFSLATDILFKVKETESQVKIKDRKTRMKNLDGVFAVRNGEKAAGRDIILFDDVTTTGSTMREAAKTLKAAGARKILALSFAH